MRIFSTSLRNEFSGLLFLLLIWWILTMLYPAYILPSPWTVVTNTAAYLPEDFWQHSKVTLLRMMSAFIVALTSGTALGILAYAKKQVKPISAMMLALQVLPGTILGVIFLLLFGAGNAAPILLAIFLTLPTLVINTVNGLAKRDTKLQQYLISIRSNKRSTFLYSYLPALIPVLQSNLHLGIGMVAKVIIMGEFIGAQNGLGFLLNNARILFNMKEVFFYLLLVLLFTLLFQITHTLIFRSFFQKYTYSE